MSVKKKKVMETANKESKFTKAKDIVVREFTSFSTTYDILDAWWSAQGGILRGRLFYLTGSSGAGKTTFLTQLQAKLKKIKSGQLNHESNSDMVKSRNPHFDYHDNFYMDDERSFPTLEEYLDYAEKEDFDFLVIDSARAAAYSIEGGKLEREIAAVRMGMEWVKRTGKNAFFVGMVTKDDEFAGSNDIMHYVDAHIHLQFDKDLNERYMKFDQKNRDGEIGKKIYYQFRDDGHGLDFFSEEEWMVKKRNIKLETFIQNAMESWIKGWKNHSNFAEFKKELSDAQNRMVREGDFSSQIHFQTQLMLKTQELAEKYFSS